MFETDIYVVRPDGTDEWRLTTTRGEVRDPAWSPDSSEIAFSSDRVEPGGDFNIYLMTADGNDQRPLTSTDDLDYEPDWSPDGEQIAFTRDGEGGDLWDLWSMNPDGGDQRILSKTPASESGARWSTDGRMLAFVCDDSGSDEICVVQADGRGRRALTKYDFGLGGAGGPDWAPAD